MTLMSVIKGFSRIILFQKARTQCEITTDKALKQVHIALIGGFIRMGVFRVMLGLSFFGLVNAYAETHQALGNMQRGDSSITQERQWVEKKNTSDSITLYSGSLKENLSRIAKHYGWKKVVWLVDSDYQWVGQVTVQEPTLYSLLMRVLQNYPLQATFYEGNHVLVITPRNV